MSLRLSLDIFVIRMICLLTFSNSREDIFPKRTLRYFSCNLLLCVNNIKQILKKAVNKKIRIFSHVHKVHFVGSN